MGRWFSVAIELDASASRMEAAVPSFPTSTSFGLAEWWVVVDGDGLRHCSGYRISKVEVLSGYTAVRFPVEIAKRVQDIIVATADVAHPIGPDAERSEERRVGKECVSTCRSRGSPCHKK